jgi:toxin ParE1/3/4
MARIIRSPEAETDALEIWTYIAEDNPTAADRLLARFNRTIHSVAAQPKIGKSVEELARIFHG